MTDIQPIDSAFTGGLLRLVPMDGDRLSLVLPGTAADAGRLTDSLPVTIIIIITTILLIASLRRIVELAPSIAGCALRWKENMNLEDSVLLSISRDRLYLILILPFCILVSDRGLYSPGFIQGLPPVYGFAATTGIFLLYLMLRKASAWCFRGRKVNIKTYTFATRTFRTFFIITAAITLVTSGIMSVADVPDDTARAVLLCETAFIYMLSILRETQIFGHSCSLISAILYLCALEFLPTGILVATAIVL